MGEAFLNIRLCEARLLPEWGTGTGAVAESWGSGSLAQGQKEQGVETRGAFSLLKHTEAETHAHSQALTLDANPDAL